MHTLLQEKDLFKIITMFNHNLNDEDNYPGDQIELVVQLDG